jgi:hypothetical protein
MYSNRNSCHIWIKLEFSGQFFKKYPNIKFHENPSSEIRVVADGQADGQDEANNRFS